LFEMRASLLVIAFLGVLGAVAVACTADDAKEYRVVVHFNTTVTEADMTSVADYLQSLGDAGEFLVQESFPPTGVGTVKSDRDDFCATVEAELESRSYVDSVDCTEANDAPVSSPDAPVESTPGE
jgi:hypothetical protein